MPPTDTKPQTNPSLAAAISWLFDAELAVERTTLPVPGGTVDLGESEQRAKDKEFIADLADLLALTYSGAGRGGGTDGRPGTFEVMRDQGVLVLEAIAEVCYQGGRKSVGEGLRDWLGLAPGAEADTWQVLEGLQRVVTRTTALDYLEAIAAAHTLPQEVLDERFSGVEDSDPGPSRLKLAQAGVTISNAILTTATAVKLMTAHAPDLKATGPDDLVRACIQMHYLASPQNFGQPVLFDGWMGVHKNPASTWKKLADATDKAADLVQRAVPINHLQGLKGPDICNLFTREVYEIKRVTQAPAGLAELYGRYLLPLNAEEMGLDLAAQILNAQTSTGEQSFSPPKQPWLPGFMWHPSPAYALPTGQIAWVVRPVPGLIVYEITKLPRTTENPALFGLPASDPHLDPWAVAVAVVVGAFYGAGIAALLAKGAIVIGGISFGTLVGGVAGMGLVTAGAAAG